jgi:iron complex outermembrane receptor protein
MPGLRFSTAYTFSDFSFDRFAKFPDVENNELPGVPTHNFYAEFAYQHSAGWFAKWDINHVSGLYADNANSVAVPSYTVSNLVFGRDIRVGNTLVTPSFGVNNLFDERYNQSIRIQESNQRYFEPAPDLNVFGALRVRFDFAG